MLTRKQYELLSFINDRLHETGVSPSFEEMKEALDLKSKSGVHRLISALEERQFLRPVLQIIRDHMNDDPFLLYTPAHEKQT